MKRNDSLGNREADLHKHCNRNGHLRIWSVVGGMALLAVGVVLVRSIPDIKRYIKISTM
jgi:hypothetical protein